MANSITVELSATSTELPRTNAFASGELGSPDFVSEINTRFLNEQTDHRNLPGLKEFVERPGIERIHAATVY